MRYSEGYLMKAITQAFGKSKLLLGNQKEDKAQQAQDNG